MKFLRLSPIFLLLFISQNTQYFAQSPVYYERKEASKPWHEKKRYAFLVGINKYKNTTELKYAVKDSKEMYKLFSQVGHFEKIFMLNDEDGKVIITKGKVESRDKQYLPTKANIESTYKAILKEKPDTLVFYYSGHGFIDGKDDKNSIAPLDVEVDFVKDKAVAKNGIVLTEMANGFKTEADKDKSEIDQVIFLIDACRSPLPKADNETNPNPNKKELIKEESVKEANSRKPNTIIEPTKEVSKEDSIKELLSFQNYGEEIPQIVNDAKGVVILIGTSPNESSLEDESIESGKFTYYMRKAISGGIQDETPAEYVTLESLELFVKKKFDLEQLEYEKVERERGLGEISQGKPKQAVYKVSTQRGFTGDFLITYGRPPETEVRVERRGYMDTSEERPVAAKLLFNKDKERYDLKFFAKSKDTGKYYPESLEGISRMKYEYEKNEEGNLRGFTAKQFNYNEESVYTHGLELEDENGWEFTSIYPLTEEDKKDKDRKKIRFQRQKFDFNGNNILQEYFDDKGLPIEIGNNKITKTIRAWDYNGEKTLEEFYNKYGDLTNNENGYARYTASYLGKGKPVTEEFFNSDGSLSGNQTGIARKTYTYDSKYKLISQKNFDKDGKLIGDKEGVAVTNYTYNFDCISRIMNWELYTGALYTDANEKARLDLEEKFKRNSSYSECVETEVYLDKSEKLKARPNGIAKKVNQFNGVGLKTLEEYFRHDERPWHKAGIFRTVYSYDDKDRVTSKKYFGETRNTSLDPVPVTDERGIHEYRYQYGTTGGGKYQFGYKKELLERVTYHGIDGNLVSTAEGISMEEHLFTYNREKKDYEEAVVHYLTQEERFIRADKKDMALKIYDENDIMLLEEFLDNGGDFKEDELGSCRYIYYYSKNDKGESRIVIPYKKDGSEGTKYDVVKIISEFDDRGNQILKARYDKDGKLKGNDEYGIAKFVDQYDQNGKLILSETYDAEDKLIGGEFGIAKNVYKYDTNGRLISKETFDAEGNLKENNYNTARSIFKYDAKGNEIEMSLYTANGKLIPHFINARTTYEYDDNANKTKEIGYKENGEIGYRTEFIFDNKNLLKEVTSYNSEEKLLAFNLNNNEPKKKYQYDNQGNKIVEETYNEDANLMAKSEYSHDQIARLNIENELKEEWAGIRDRLIDAVAANGSKTKKQSIESEISIWEKKDKLMELLMGSLGQEKGRRLFNEFQDFKNKYTKELENCILRKISYKGDGTLVERVERFDRFHPTTKEKLDANGVLESPEYHLYFLNPRGQFEKRLLHMKLDRFYRPVGLEFEKR